MIQQGMSCHLSCSLKSLLRTRYSWDGTLRFSLVSWTSASHFPYRKIPYCFIFSVGLLNILVSLSSGLFWWAQSQSEFTCYSAAVGQQEVGGKENFSAQQSHPEL